MDQPIIFMHFIIRREYFNEKICNADGGGEKRDHYPANAYGCRKRVYRSGKAQRACSMRTSGNSGEYPPHLAVARGNRYGTENENQCQSWHFGRLPGIRRRNAQGTACHRFWRGSNYGFEQLRKTNDFRRALLAKSPAMVGTVPVYDAIGYLEKDLAAITAQDFLQVVSAHAQEGVDFMTIHAGINKRTVEAFRRTGRRMNIVSRGGSLLFAWMEMTGNENPFYEHYDELLDLLRAYDVTISLGDALRPGCIDDSSDAGQICELIELGNLTKRAWEKDVQVMVEGPGHMALNEIAANMALQKRLCHNAPFYVLGPIVTDIAPGYDHITSAIGGAVAAANGADFLCYVTPAEHLRLPDVNDVKEGIVASRIAAHAADIAKGIPHARRADNAMAQARREMDWERMFKLAIDGDKARTYYESKPPSDRHSCSMCGKMCAVRTSNKILSGQRVELCPEEKTEKEAQ